MNLKPITKHTGTSSVQPAPMVIERLPTELFWKLVHRLDSHSLRSLLRAFPSLGLRVTLVLGPQHEGHGSPIFFTGFPCADLRCSNGDELPYCQGSVNLYEINTRSKHFQKFIDTEMKHLKSMSFIHFTGNVSVMGKTCIMRTLNSMHPFAPRISFQYSAPLKYPRKKRMPSVTERNNGSDTIRRLTFTRRPDDLPSIDEYTAVSLDCRLSHTIKDISWKKVKQLEITFYKGNSTPIIQNIDLPLVQSFRINFYERVPLIFNTKVGYASKGYNVFEMLNTTAFDVHYGAHCEKEMRWNTYEDRMDLSFTENFDSLFFVGVYALIMFKFCNFSKATSLFWYHSILTLGWLKGTSRDTKKKLKLFWRRSYRCLPHVKSFTCLTNRKYADIPANISMPELEVVRIYTNNSGLAINSVLHAGFGWVDIRQNNLTSVDICCDLPLEQVGSDDHILLDWRAVEAILCSNRLKFVSISGCYFGDCNYQLTLDLGRLVSAVEWNAGKPKRKSFNLELVRNMSEIDGALEISLLTELATYLTHLKISLVPGDENYTPWPGLVVKFSEIMLTDGLVVEIDSSFGIPKLQYTEGYTTYEMSTAQSAVAPTIGVSKSLRKWIAGKGESADGTWRMIPTGTSTE